MEVTVCLVLEVNISLWLSCFSGGGVVGVGSHCEKFLGVL